MDSSNSRNVRESGVKAKARWSILRNALLRKATQTSKHSIHSFPGYMLVRRIADPQANANVLESKLKVFTWSHTESFQVNLQDLEIRCLSLAAVSPRGQCLKVVNYLDDVKLLLQQLRELCKSVLTLIHVPEDDKRITTFLVQESRSSTKYTVCQYELGTDVSFWVREPRENLVSLSDLVSHRNTGVDNTGNVCIWDSELTLSYLLYNHSSELPCLRDVNLSEDFGILELGTGMAGLAAYALGLRLIPRERPPSRITLTLTDGHPSCVQNNRINHFLTALALGTSSPYQRLRISAQTLLWTNEDTCVLSGTQDIVLVSDCTHFQTFHSALAITTLRCLKVGGSAVFCQPNRSDSLDNFVNMVTESRVDGLVSIQWWSHSIVESAHSKAKEEYPALYDDNLHHPRILIVTKLRQLTSADCSIIALIHDERK